MSKQQKPETFRVDNALIQNAPFTFAAKRGVMPKGVQMYLPGDLAPFGPFDYWATLGLYALLDPNDPRKPVETTQTEILELLHFTRDFSELLGYPTYAGRDYAMVDDTLHRLFTVEVNWRNWWSVKTGKRGRPKKQWVEFRGRILQSIEYIYPEGVTPPGDQPRHKRKNVNKTIDSTGQPGPPLYKNVDGPRPERIRYQFSDRMVNGLTKADPNIGATTIPLRIFDFRRELKNDMIGLRLLAHVFRQTAKAPRPKRLDRLAADLNLNPNQRRRNQDAILKKFEWLKAKGVVADWSTYEEDGQTWVSYTKADDWHYPTDKKSLTSEAE